MDFLFKKSTESNSQEKQSGANDQPSFSFKFSEPSSTVFSFLDNGISSTPNQTESPSHPSSNSFIFLFKEATANNSSSNDLPIFMKSFLNSSQSDKADISVQEDAPIFRSSSMQDELSVTNVQGTSTGKRSNQAANTIEDSSNESSNPTSHPIVVQPADAINNLSPNGPPSKKLKTATLNVASESTTNSANSASQKQTPVERREGSVLPFTAQKFSLNSAQKPQSMHPSSESNQVSTPKKTNASAEKSSPIPSSVNNSRVSLSAMSPPPNKPTMVRAALTPSKTAAASPDQSPFKTPPISQPSKSSQASSPAQDSHNLSFERSEKIVANHRSELEELKLVENQLNGVKRKDSEMTKTMEDLHAKMLEHSDTLRALSLKVSILTNKLLMAESPAFRESIDKLHLKYADLLNNNP